MKKVKHMISLLAIGSILMSACENDVEESKSTIPKEELKSELVKESQDEEYINNIANHMSNFLREGQYTSAILTYKTNIQNGINRTANETIVQLYNEAVKGYISLKDKGEHPNLEFDRNILSTDLIPLVDKIEKSVIKKQEAKDAKELANQEYLKNMAIHMEKFIEEGKYESAISLYEKNILNGISIKPNAETEALFNKALTLNGDEIPTVNASETTTPETKATSTTTHKPTVNPDVLYDYVQEQFDILTNYGDTYVPEIHDPIVMEKAARRFNITLRQAEELYYEGAGF